jgi:hypothetical protein
MRLEDMAGKFGIEIKPVGTESDVYIIKCTEIESISPILQSLPSLKPDQEAKARSGGKPNQEAKAKDNVTIDISLIVSEINNRSKTTKSKHASPSRPSRTSVAPDLSRTSHCFTSPSIEKLENEIFAQSRNRNIHHLNHPATPENEKKLFNQKVPSSSSVTKPTDLSPILNQSAIYTLIGSDMATATVSQFKLIFLNVFCFLNFVSFKFDDGQNRLNRLLQCDYCLKALNDPIYLSCCGKTVCRNDLAHKTTCVLCKHVYSTGQVFHSNEKIADLLLLRKNFDLDEIDGLELESSNYFIMLIS